MQRPGALFVALVGMGGFERRVRKPGLSANLVEVMAESVTPARIVAAGPALLQIVVTSSTNTTLHSKLA